MKPFLAQVATEVRLTLTQGENLLVTLGIPVVILVAFDFVHVLPTGTRHPISFLAPSVLALAIMSTGLVSLAIATGFERTYGVLKRLGSTPLGRPGLLGAKIASVLVVELAQVVVLVGVSLGLGWHPGPGIGAAVGAVLLGTMAFAGLGLLLAGTLPGEVVLGVANLLWLLLLLAGGIVFPISHLPAPVAGAARALPAAALSLALHGSLGRVHSVPATAWATLAGWAVALPALAMALFRWE